MDYLIMAVIIVVAIVFAIRAGKRKRNSGLDAWGASIPVTPVQKMAMQELWDASQVKQPPTIDPLAKLPPQDKAYILKICSSSFRPAQFGNADTLRIASFLQLQEYGFTTEQASVIIGMIFNSVGK